MNTSPTMMPSSNTSSENTQGVLRRFFCGVALPVMAFVYIHMGLSRFIGSVSFPFGVRPSHLAVLFAGALEILLGVSLLITDHRLKRGSKGTPNALVISLVLCVVHYVGRIVFFTIYHKLPEVTLRNSFWFWLVVLLAFSCVCVLCCQKNRKQNRE